MRVVSGVWLGVLALACGAAAALIVQAWPARATSRHRAHRQVIEQPASDPVPLVERPGSLVPVLSAPAPQVEARPNAVVVPPPIAVVPAPSAWPIPSAPLALSSASASANQAEPAPVRRTPRRVPLAALSAWLKPGLCSESGDASATRDKLTQSFRVLDGAELGQLHLDPRLPEGAEAAVLSLLERARGVALRQFGASPPPPSVYVYADVQLLKAAACINEDVVAFYDGALHLVAGRPDLLVSVVHEYTHHVLFSSGLMGPSWAQEGIAMSAAGELWWRRPELLRALMQLPFSAEQMDRTIAYKLPPPQAVSFYVQSALTVQCLQSQRHWTLGQLADALRAGSASDAVSYDLPELEQSSFLTDCIAGLAGR